MGLRCKVGDMARLDHPALPENKGLIVCIERFSFHESIQKCAGKTACSEVYDTGKCNVWINTKATTERDYGAAVRKCFQGRV